MLDHLRCPSCHWDMSESKRPRSSNCVHSGNNIDMSRSKGIELQLTCHILACREGSRLTSKWSGAFQNSKEGRPNAWQVGLLQVLSPLPISVFRSPILAVSRAYKGHKLSMIKTKPNSFSSHAVLLPDFLASLPPTTLPPHLAPKFSITISSPLSLLT